MKTNNLDFKWNEITSLFEHAKSIGMMPTLTIRIVKLNFRNGAWLELRLRSYTLFSRAYEKEWLIPRIKQYMDFNKKCPYGEIRVIEKAR